MHILQRLTLLLLGLTPMMVSAQTDGYLVREVRGSGNKALVLFLHGDMRNGDPRVNLEGIASDLSAKLPAATVVALLRPGFSDTKGEKSDGFYERDAYIYTKRNNALLAKAISELEAQINPARLIVIGFSGGAAQLGVIIATHPGMIDTAVLVSCPCRDQATTSWRSRDQYPDRYVAKVPDTTRIFALTGSKDTVTPPSLARDYVEMAKENGLAADFGQVPMAAHVFDELQTNVLSVVRAEIDR